MRRRKAASASMSAGLESTRAAARRHSSISTFDVVRRPWAIQIFSPARAAPLKSTPKTFSRGLAWSVDDTPADTLGSALEPAQTRERHVRGREQSVFPKGGFDQTLTRGSHARGVASPRDPIDVSNLGRVVEQVTQKVKNLSPRLNANQ